MTSIHGEEFDVAIIGSGLTESIAAAACARAGLKVIHLDQNEFYGTMEATITFAQFMELAGHPVSSDGYEEINKRNDDSIDEVDAEGHKAEVFEGENYFEKRFTSPTSLCGFEVIEMSPIPGAPTVNNCNVEESQDVKLSTISSVDTENTINIESEAIHSDKMTADVANANDLKQNHNNSTTSCDDKEPNQVPNHSNSTLLKELMQESRNFAIDVSPRLLFCRGDMVDLLVQSGVSHYVEFQPLEAAVVATSNGNNDDDKALKQVRVPCSKSGIFKTKDITMSEKRQLMKFFQYCMDTSVKENTGEVDGFKWSNEKRLNQGRSLPRPQNKDLDKLEPDSTSDDDEKPFREFLQTTCKLSEKLQDFVLYGVALLDSDEGVTKKVGMSKVQDYLHGLGRFGATCFLCPMYGTSELAQAFTRMCAIYGGIYQLRQTQLQLVVESTCTENESAPVFKASGLILASGDVIKCQKFIVQSDYVFNPEHREGTQCTYIERLICITNSPLIESSNGDDETGVRALLVIPPHTNHIGNSSAIHVLQFNSGSCVVPKGKYIVHLTTLVSSEPGCDSQDSAVRAQVLKKALESLLESSSSDPSCIQWQVSLEKMSRNIMHEESTESSIDAHEDDTKVEWQNISNIIFAESAKEIETGSAKGNEFQLGLELSMKSYVTRAKAIFEKLCPNAEFLPESAASVQASAFEEDDLAILAAQQIRLPQRVDLTFFEYLGGKVEQPPPMSHL